MANANVVILQNKGTRPFHWTWTGSVPPRDPRMYFPTNVQGLTRAEADLNLQNPLPPANPWTEVVDYNVTPLPPPWPKSANGIVLAGDEPPAPPPVEPPPETGHA
jgi:hypothetical protein